jgi:hypothetical protein
VCGVKFEHSCTVFSRYDTVNLTFHVPNNIYGQFHIRFYTEHLYIGFLNILLAGRCGETSCYAVQASLNIFHVIITQNFCNLVGHLKDLEGGYNRMLEVTSMFALTVKGVEKLLPSSPPSDPLLVTVVLQFSV